MPKIPELLEDRAKRLHRDGLNFVQIAQILKVSFTTVRLWVIVDDWTSFNKSKAAYSLDRFQKNPIKYMKELLRVSKYHAKRLGYLPCIATAEELLESFEGRCGVCKRDIKVCLDHCHKTGRFRGWLCRSCNTVMGHLDNRLDLYLAYIKQSNGPKTEETS